MTFNDCSCCIVYINPINYHAFGVYRAETQDGGDAKVEVTPRDIIYTQPAKPLEGEKPAILHQLDLRYGYEDIYKVFLA